tara:strand:+ start:573 stop:1598 length:1026 start_codon:yes stop_codon:yes gene_type:complete
MIKVKILNATKGRNEPTFRPFFVVRDMIKDYSIEFTYDSDDYDFLFVGMDDFLDKSKPLEESIEWGLENLSKITGDYFLFDGSDSTSLMGAYEVFENSNAIYLLKNQKFYNKEDYKTPYAFNKYFFGSGSDLDLSYDIPEDMWNRIKFTHINLGYWNDYRNLQPINPNKNIDMCAIFQAEHRYSEDHGVRNDLHYTNHRKGLWDKLEPLKSKYSMLTERMPFQEYMKNLWNSKISLSPFGMGEFCFRDLESMMVGTIVLKPSHEKVDTLPNMMIDNETFIPCKYDWSDLEEKIDYILSNFDELNERINHNIRSMFLDKFTNENLCLYYYNLFSKLNNIGEE